jgi:hypothetical protein|tara:strand:+ start:271 stop:432 length:162 start_codon:yes stop_codon:yes gene_type:complete
MPSRKRRKFPRGSGQGFVPWRMGNRGVGGDLSPACLEKTQKNAALHNIEAKFE